MLLAINFILNVIHYQENVHLNSYITTETRIEKIKISALSKLRTSTNQLLLVHKVAKQCSSVHMNCFLHLNERERRTNVCHAWYSSLLDRNFRKVDNPKMSRVFHK